MSNYYSRKRKISEDRYDDYKKHRGNYEHDDERELPPQEDELESLIYRLGEKSQTTSIESSYETVASYIETKISHKKDHIISLIYECISKLPEKINVYATLIGLLNIKKFNFVGELLEHLSSCLKDSIKNGHFFIAHRLIRFITNLVNVKVITTQSIFEIFEHFVGLTATFNDTDRIQARIDFYVYCMLSSLPWCGKEIYDKHGPQLDDLLKTLQDYLKKRDKSYMPMLKVWLSDDPNPQEDYLDCLWSQIKKLEENDWKETQIMRSYKSFDFSHSRKHDFPFIAVPECTDRYLYPSPRVIFRMFDYTDVPEDYILPGSHSIERFIIEEQLHSIIHTYYLDRKLCAQQLLGLNHLNKIPLNYMIVEVIFSQLFNLPKPVHLELFFGSLLIELCKLQPTQMPMVLAQATELLFDRLDSMKTSAIERFSNWFSYHLSNFQFKWAWDDWKSCLANDINSPKAKFIQETLLKSIRLSYHQRIAELLPESVGTLLPLDTKPIYKYESEDAVNLEGTQMANRILELLKNRCLPEDIIQVLRESSTESIVKMEDDSTQETSLSTPLKIEVFTSTLFYFGSKSFSHIFSSLAKFHMIFKMIIETEDQQLIVLKTLHEIWKNRQQMMVVLVDKLLKTQIVECSSVINWIFSNEMRQDFNYFYVWEILHSTVNRMSKQVEKLHQDYIESEEKFNKNKLNEAAGYDITTEEEDLRFKLERLSSLRDEQKRLFHLMLKQFVDRLDSFIKESIQNGIEFEKSNDYKWLNERFQDVLLIHNEEIFPYLAEFKHELLGNETHEQVIKIFKTFESMKI